MKITAEQKNLDTGSLAFEQTVQQLKNKYGNIYQIEIADQRLIFKPISRKEYKEIMGNTFDMDVSDSDVIFTRETMIAKAVTVYPDKEIVEKIMEDFAGAAEVITEECMKVSGFLSEKDRVVTKL